MSEETGEIHRMLIVVNKLDTAVDKKYKRGSMVTIPG